MHFLYVCWPQKLKNSTFPSQCVAFRYPELTKAMRDAGLTQPTEL